MAGKYDSVSSQTLKKVSGGVIYGFIAQINRIKDAN